MTTIQKVQETACSI